MVTLPDGRTIEFLGVTVGTNRLTFDSPLERILTKYIPISGMKLGPWTIRSPIFLQGFYEADAHAWLAVRGPNVLTGSPDYNYNTSQVVTSNRFGREFSIPEAHYFGSTMNAIVLHVPLVAFPRNDRTAILRLRPPSDEPESRWIEFPFQNPFLTSAPTWNPPRAPVTNRFDGHDFILLSATASELIFTLPSNDWSIPHCRVFDNEGNAAAWSLMEGPRADGRASVMFSHSLETNRAWRVDATFARGYKLHQPVTNFPPEQLRTAHVTRAQPATLTNLAGEVFTLQLDSGLKIQTPDRAGLPCWVILGTKDENNQTFELPGGTGWMNGPPGSGSLNQVYFFTKSASALDLQLACPPSFTAQFFVLPQP